MFTIMFWDTTNLWTEIATIHGCEAAYEAYSKARDFAELIMKDCAMIDAETGEIVEYYNCEEN